MLLECQFFGKLVGDSFSFELGSILFALICFQNVEALPLQNGCDLPSAASPVTMATVVSAKTLTHPTAVKKTLICEVDITVGACFCSD